MNPRSVPFFLVLAGCTGTMAATDKDEATDGIYSETGDADTAETGNVDTVETGDTGSVETGGETGTIETGDSGDTDRPEASELDVWPTAMTVNPGASYRLRVVTTARDGTEEEARGASFASGDEFVATVDPTGVITAVAAGATQIQVDASGLTEFVDITVQDELAAYVTIVDGTTGLAIEGATVRTAIGDFTTDATGLAVATVADANAATLTAWINEDYHAVSLLETVGRSFTIPLAVLADDTGTAELHGTVDFGAVPDSGFSELVVGVACATVQQAPAMFDLADLLAENRTVSVFGVDADVPSNLFIETYAEDFSAPARSGPVATWGISGPIAIADVTAGLNDAGDALELFIANLDHMVWGLNTGYVAVAGSTTEVSLAPSEDFTDTLSLALPTLPLGFDGSEEQFVLTMDERVDEGFVVTGMGLGAGLADVDRVTPGSVPASIQSVVYTYAQAGGVGSGLGTSVSVAEEGRGTVTFPDLLDLPAVNSWNAGTRELDVTTDGDAQLVRISLIDDNGRVHDFYTDASWAGVVDKSMSEFERGQATVQVEAYAGLDGNLEHWFSTATFDPAGLSPDRRARERLVKE